MIYADWLFERMRSGVMQRTRNPLPRNPDDRPCATGPLPERHGLRGRRGDESGDAFAGEIVT